MKGFGLSPMTEPVAVKRRVGYVAEDQVLPPSARIAELLAFHRSLFPTWDDALERQLLDRFGLADRSRKIRVLSKGQARQVALVLAVCHRPELLILDEPAGGLDPAARREFLETSIQLLNQEGTSILFSSHHMGDVERLGGRVVLVAPNEATHGEWAKVLNVPVVVEILSPSTARYDRFGKRMIYREVGVETFWIIDANTCVVEEWTPRAISARLLTTYATCSDFRRSVRPVTASH